MVLTQKDSGAEAGYEPTFTLYSEGTFELSATFYDGTATITGTYVEEGDSYVLTPGESTAQGVVGSDVGQMTLTAGGSGIRLFRRAAGADIRRGGVFAVPGIRKW